MGFNTFEIENTCLGLSKIKTPLKIKEATFISHQAMLIISCLLHYLFHSITEKKVETYDPGFLDVFGPKSRKKPHFASQFENLRLKF